MPHFCWVCSSLLANERFTGRGHRQHVCRDCQRLPGEQRDAVAASQEISGMLFDQSHISGKNLVRLRHHLASPDAQIAAQAAAMLEVALVTPYRRKRLSILRRDHPHLITHLTAVGLLDHSIDETAEDELAGEDIPW
jgi:hypothetical protein